MATADKDELLTNSEFLDENRREGGIDWLQLLDNVISKWYWILLSVVVAMLICWVYLKKKPNVYQVQSSVLIKDESNDVFKDQSMMSSRTSFSSVFSVANNFSTEMDIIASRSLIKRVVESLDLYINLTRTDKFRPEDLYEDAPIKLWMAPALAEDMQGGSLIIKLHKNGSLDVEGAVGSKKHKKGVEADIKKHFAKMPAIINTRYGVISISRVDSVPLKEDMEISGSIVAPTTAAANYKARLGVEQTNKESFIASLTMNDTKPERSIRFINRLVEAYNEDANEDKNQTAEKTAQFIENRIEKIARELGGTESSLAGFKRSAGLTDLTSDAKAAIDGRTKYEQAITENETRLNMIQYMKEYVKQNLQNNEIFPVSVGISNDNGLAALIGEYNKNVIERNRMARGSAGENNSVLQKADVTLQDMRNNIHTTLASLESGAKITKRRLEQEASRFAGAINSAPEDEKQFLSIARQRDFQSQLYLLLLQKREENAIKLAATANNGRIIEYPETGGIVSPRRGMIKMIALLLGLAFPIGIIYLRLLLAVKVKNRDDVMRLTKLPLIGDIPLDKSSNGERRIIVHENANEMMDEAFRSLRTNIQFMLHSTEQKVIMFTSALSGEGKSTVACNLAASYAFLGKRVVVVGLDIRRPGLNKVFHFSTRLSGISQFLADPENNNLMDFVIQSDVSKNLFVLPGGIIPPNPTELVSQNSLEQAIEILKANFDMVILDTAPVGLVSDSQVISRVADMTVVVVRSDFSYKSSVAMVDDMAAQKVLPNVGITLNGVDLEKNRGYYGNYGRYGYKRYGYRRYGYRRYGYSNYSYGYGYGYGQETQHTQKGFLAKVKKLFRK